MMMFPATFNNISDISWRSVLLEEETGVSGEDPIPAASHWQIVLHNVVSSTSRLSWILYPSTYFNDVLYIYTCSSINYQM
jgi:hypothetical protein